MFAKLAKEYSDDLNHYHYNRREAVIAVNWSETECAKAQKALKKLRKRHANYLKLCEETD